MFSRFQLGAPNIVCYMVCKRRVSSLDKSVLHMHFKCGSICLIINMLLLAFSALLCEIEESTERTTTACCMVWYGS